MSQKHQSRHQPQKLHSRLSSCCCPSFSSWSYLYPLRREEHQAESNRPQCRVHASLCALFLFFPSAPPWFLVWVAQRALGPKVSEIRSRGHRTHGATGRASLSALAVGII